MRAHTHIQGFPLTLLPLLSGRRKEEEEEAARRRREEEEAARRRREEEQERKRMMAEERKRMKRMMAEIRAALDEVRVLLSRPLPVVLMPALLVLALRGFVASSLALPISRAR